MPCVDNDDYLIIILMMQKNKMFRRVIKSLRGQIDAILHRVIKLVLSITGSLTYNTYMGVKNDCVYVNCRLLIITPLY